MTPQFKNVRFEGQDGMKAFRKWLAENTKWILELEDQGQDLTKIWVHETGEILHCDAHAGIYNGKFLNLEYLNEGDNIQVWSEEDKEWCPKVLVIENVI